MKRNVLKRLRPWKSNKHHLVVLAVDTKERCFELLSLVFPKHALVSDVIREISLNFSRQSLQKQRYVGLCGRGGQLSSFAPNLPLSKIPCCDDVLIAIPEGINARGCVEPALRILSQPSVNAAVSTQITAKQTAWRSELDRKETDFTAESLSEEGEPREGWIETDLPSPAFLPRPPSSTIGARAGRAY